MLLSQTVAELVRDHLPEGIALRDLGHYYLRGLSRGENVYELSRQTEPTGSEPALRTAVASPLIAPPLPAALVPAGPFVGRVGELAQLEALWRDAVAGTGRAVSPPRDCPETQPASPHRGGRRAVRWG